MLIISWISKLLEDEHVTNQVHSARAYPLNSKKNILRRKTDCYNLFPKIEQSIHHSKNIKCAEHGLHEAFVSGKFISRHELQ